MRFDIMTLFPEAVSPMLNASILGRAQKKGLIEIHAHQIRDYTVNRQNQVDDYPYGGGRGAIMQCDPLWRCWCAVCDEISAPVHTVFLSPCGPAFDQAKARQLEASYDNLILVCGHYEGVDQRFLDECVDEEISMGDFVLTGGAPSPWPLSMPSRASSPACSATRSASPTRAIGTDCLNTRSIPGPTNGTG